MLQNKASLLQDLTQAFPKQELANNILYKAMIAAAVVPVLASAATVLPRHPTAFSNGNE